MPKVNFKETETAGVLDISIVLEEMSAELILIDKLNGDKEIYT